MIRLYGVSRDSSSIESFYIGADGILNVHPSYFLSSRSKHARISSNMGKPCWFSTCLTDNLLDIYDCDDMWKVCGTIHFAERSYAMNYAAIVSDVPLAFTSDRYGVNKVVTSRCEIQIWGDRNHGIINPMAIVDRTGSVLYVDEKNDNDGAIRPIGEHLPFGVWLPPAPVKSNAKMFAAYGGIVTCTNVNLTYIPIWDIRAAGESARIHDGMMQMHSRNCMGEVANNENVAQFARCVFTNEHLLTTCYNYADDTSFGEVGTVVWDLRNMDCYDLGRTIERVSFNEVHAF